MYAIGLLFINLLFRCKQSWNSNCNFYIAAYGNREMINLLRRRELKERKKDALFATHLVMCSLCGSRVCLDHPACSFVAVMHLALNAGREHAANIHPRVTVLVSLPSTLWFYLPLSLALAARSQPLPPSTLADEQARDARHAGINRGLRRVRATTSRRRRRRRQRHLLTPYVSWG